MDSDDRSGSRETHQVGFCDEHRVVVNVLPDDILLYIFLIDGLEYQNGYPGVSLLGLEDVDRVRRLPWTWHRLVHVCRRWRSIVFASPNFLDLRLVCSPRTPMELTGIWPPLPIILTNVFHIFDLHMPEDYHDFDATIVHHNRIREICLFGLTISQLKRLATQMQEQFPELTHLFLSYPFGVSTLVSAPLPDGFLGGSAPRLQSLWLSCISYPALPKLLLSATHLVRLHLYRIPHSGYFLPGAIVSALAVMANLKSLTIKLESPLSRPHRESRRSPPPIRTVLPALTHFVFKGASEYLEDLVARIDALLLNSIYVTFFHQLIFDIPQLAKFMGRTASFQELKEAHVEFNRNEFRVETLPPTQTSDEKSGLKISCKELDWQLSSLAQVLTSFFPSVYMVEHLYLYEHRYQRQENIEIMQWLEIFHPFTAVKNLYLCEILAPSIVPALQELVGGRTMEVLPMLQNIFLEGQPSRPILEGIQNFVAARLLSRHPINVSLWERDSGCDWEIDG